MNYYVILKFERDGSRPGDGYKEEGRTGLSWKRSFLVLNFTPYLLSKQLIEKHVNNVSSCWQGLPLYWMIILCGVYVLLRNLEFLLKCFRVNGYKILFSSGGTVMFFTCLSTNIIKMVDGGS